MACMGLASAAVRLPAQAVRPAAGQRTKSPSGICSAGSPSDFSGRAASLPMCSMGPSLMAGARVSSHGRPAGRGGVSCSSSAEEAGPSGQDSTMGLAKAMKLLKTHAAKKPSVGQVWLVGTGPGDPGLLTLRALQLMQTADVVLYDRLVSDDILSLVHDGARMVYVGKEAGFHTRTQDEIHDLLSQFADEGNSVLRLKGGDPYVFGRGGEEVEYLEARGVTVRCVPGITAAAGIGAELGIPMTHRGSATSVRYLTGHVREDGDDLEELVAAAVDPNMTLVVYMGLGSLPMIAELLQQHGLEASTPSVAVERGTTPEQRVVFSELSDLPASVAAAALKSPTLLVIGKVVALAHGWDDGYGEALGEGGREEGDGQGGASHGEHGMWGQEIPGMGEGSGRGAVKR